MPNELQEITDRLALRQLVEDYAHGCDRRETGAVARLFTEDGRLAKIGVAGQPTTETRGRAAIEVLLDGLRRYDATTHFLGQQSVIVDKDTARGETYCLAHHIYRNDGDWYNRVMGIRYLDTYRRQDARWRFEDRRLVVDWIEYRPMGSLSVAPPWAREGDAAISRPPSS